MSWNQKDHFRKLEEKEAETVKLKQIFNKWLHIADHTSSTSAGKIANKSENTELNCESDDAGAMAVTVSDPESSNTDELQAKCLKHEDKRHHHSCLPAVMHAQFTTKFQWSVTSLLLTRILTEMFQPSCRDIDLNNPELWLPITDTNKMCIS